MRNVLFLLGLVCVVAGSAAAQATPTGPLLLTSPSLTPAASAPLTVAPGAVAPATSAPAEPPQGVLGVFQNYSWQAYFGYTFLRFYEVPGLTKSMNGFSYSMAYYFKDWVAADGELTATWGTQSKLSADFIFAGGGPRFRWSAPRGLELWGHGLVGYAHFSPQTPFGNQEAFTYVVGGGVDVNAHHRKWAYRLQADMVGSHFFRTYQYSPKISAGFVYKF